jgi:hypothetical protein
VRSAPHLRGSVNKTIDGFWVQIRHTATIPLKPGRRADWRRKTIESEAAAHAAAKICRPLQGLLFFLSPVPGAHAPGYVPVAPSGGSLVFNSPTLGSRPRLMIYRRSAALLLAMRWTYLIVIPREQSESRDPFDSAFGLAQDKPAGIQQTNAQPMDPSARSRCSLGRDDRAGGPVSPALGMRERGAQSLASNDIALRIAKDPGTTPKVG